jgi:phosphatidylinositol glycan class B
MAFAILGLGFWLLFIKKIKWQNWSALIFVASITMAICICIDRWFYGAWVFTPYNYFNVNIIQNVAASFGTDPWWKYFELFIVMVIPPLSLVLFWFLGKGIILKKQHVFTFVLIPFLIGHFIIGHKEMRFLFPMCFIFIFLASIGADYYIQKYNSRKIFRFGYKFLMVFNIIMLTYRTFLPAHETVPYYNFAYINLPKKTTVLCLQVYLFGLSDNLHANFYKPNYINEIIFKTEDDINNYIVNSSQDSIVVYTNSSKLGNVLAKYKHKRIYTLYPEWVLKYNINNWQDRANISCLYTLYKN